MCSFVIVTFYFKKNIFVHQNLMLNIKVRHGLATRLKIDENRQHMEAFGQVLSKLTEQLLKYNFFF
jgi:hypothetical protein